MELDTALFLVILVSIGDALTFITMTVAGAGLL